MDFPVPQFIEIEEKILGPLSIKQVLYLVGAGAVIFILYFFVETWLFFILAVLIGGTAAAFAFVKVGGRTLSAFLSSVFTYAFMPRVFIWKKTEEKEIPEKLEKIELTKAEPIIKTEGGNQKLMGSGLRKISKTVDIGVKTRKLEEEAEEKLPDRLGNSI